MIAQGAQRDGQVAEQDLSQSFHCLGRFPSTMMPAFFDQAGALLITPPLKIVRGSGSPLRVLALVDQSEDD